GGGDGLPWCPGTVWPLRSLVCLWSVADRFRRTDLEFILAQHFAGSTACTRGGRNGADYRCLLRRASAFRRDSCSGTGISYQCGGSATLGASAARNAFYDLVRDKRRI